MRVSLREIWEAPKELAAEPDWKRRGADEYLRVTCPVDAFGITIMGLKFTASAHIYTPDRSVSFQLVYDPPLRSNGYGPMSRVEWKPRSPHNNRGLGPADHRFKDIFGCHLHPFDENLKPAGETMRKGNLPIAVPIEPGFSTYEEVLDFVEKEFRIKGVKGLPPPPWTRPLL